jgi:hypothetical protein
LKNDKHISFVFEKWKNISVYEFIMSGAIYPGAEEWIYKR